jgi:VanZ family protein
MGWFVAALFISVLALVFTLLPATSPLVYRASQFLGGTELTDALGHVLLFSVLTSAWYATLREHVGNAKAPVITAGLVLALGVATELAQAGIVDRGASLLDLGADALGVSLAVFSIRRE